MKWQTCKSQSRENITYTEAMLLRSTLHKRSSCMMLVYIYMLELELELVNWRLPTNLFQVICLCACVVLGARRRTIAGEHSYMIEIKESHLCS